MITLVCEAFHTSLLRFIGSFTVIYGHLLRSSIISHAMFSYAPRLADFLPMLHRAGIAIMSDSHRQDSVTVILTVRRDPRTCRIEFTYNVTPFFPCLQLQRHEVRTVIYIKDYRLVLVADTPSEDRSMVAVTEDKTPQMILGGLPEMLRIEFRTAVTGPVRGLVKYAYSHFIGKIEVETRIYLCMRTYGIAVHVLYGLEPGPGITAGHLRNAHEMPRIAS